MIRWIDKLLYKARKRRFCKLNRWFCPDCIYHDFMTENSSEKPNSCDTCKWGEWYRNGRDITNMDDECGGCCSWNSKWTPKETETEAERLDRIDNEIEDAYARIRELTADTPQTEEEFEEPNYYDPALWE